MVLSACYALFLLNRVIYADLSPYVVASPQNRDLTRREFAILLPLVILTLILGIYPDYILGKVHNSVSVILAYLS
jgi:NADH:ubiquinone oxidoreductase subunit 4 (subunit M)